MLGRGTSLGQPEWGMVPDDGYEEAQRPSRVGRGTAVRGGNSGRVEAYAAFWKTLRGGNESLWEGGDRCPKRNGSRAEGALMWVFRGLFPSTGEGLSHSLGRRVSDLGAVTSSSFSPSFFRVGVDPQLGGEDGGARALAPGRRGRGSPWEELKALGLNRAFSITLLGATISCSIETPLLPPLVYIWVINYMSFSILPPHKLACRPMPVVPFQSPPPQNPGPLPRGPTLFQLTPSSQRLPSPAASPLQSPWSVK